MVVGTTHEAPEASGPFHYCHVVVVGSQYGMLCEAAAPVAQLSLQGFRFFVVRTDGQLPCPLISITHCTLFQHHATRAMTQHPPGAQKELGTLGIRFSFWRFYLPLWDLRLVSKDPKSKLRHGIGLGGIGSRVAKPNRRTAITQRGDLQTPTCSTKVVR